MTSIYRKPTFSGLYLKFDSFVPIQFKRGLINSLLYRAWKICSTEQAFQSDMSKIQSLLLSNGYPRNFFESCKKHFLTNIDKRVAPEFGPEKKKIYFSLPYIGIDSAKLKRQIMRLVNHVNPSLQLIVIFKPSFKLAGLLSRLKSPIALLNKSNVVYRIDCDNCNAFYLGVTQRRLFDRLSEHRTSDKSSVYRHCSDYNHTASSVKIVTTETNKERLYILESLSIKEQQAFRSLNNQVSSVPLQLW